MAEGIIQRIRRGAPGVRVILVPKQRMIDDIDILRGPSRVAQQVEEVAQRFDERVRPAMEQLKKIGLRDVTGTDLRKESLAANAAGERKVWAGAGMFERLSLVRAVAIRLQDDEKIHSVIDATADEFNVVLDVRTDSHATLTKTWPAGRLRKHAWPEDSGLTEAWDRNIRGTGVVVGVLDTGIDADHIEFRGRQVEFRYFPPSALDGATSRNVRGFDTDGHGTHVCGIIAGKRVGLARDVNLHVASVIESETLRASLWRTVYGLDWMFRRFVEKDFVNVPCVVNLSLCFFEDLMTSDEVADWDLVLGRAIEDLHRKDALVIAAAGNRGKGYIGFPAKFNNVLAVGAVDSTGNVAGFSGTPTATARRDIYGYGVDIVSAFERSKDGQSHYLASNGTSMAAPYVTGIASMLRQTNPGASAQDVRNHLFATSINAGNGVHIARFQHWP